MRGFFHRYLESMEKIDWNRVKATIRNWKPGEYIRQTSIVVIGVLITFVGSELVTRCSEQKDIKSTMLLIRDELKTIGRTSKRLCLSSVRMNAFPLCWWSMI